MALNTRIRGNQIKDDFFGSALIRNGANDDIMDVNVDDSTIEVSADALQVKDSGISTSKIANDAVDKDKIASDVAGNGLGQNVDGSLEVNVDDSSIEISGDSLQVKALGITNAMLAGSIADGKLAEDYIKTSEVDGTTIEFSGGSLNVVANGIGAAEIDETDTYDFTGGTVQVATPSADNDAANKSYVDDLVNGLQWKDPVRAKSTASDGNITLSGVSGQSLDSVSLSADDRVLLTEQTDASENGIWEVKSGAWTRPSDFPTAGDAVNATVLVSEGTDNADTQWTCTNNADADTIDTNDLAFVQISGTGSITAGDGLSKTGNTLDVNVDDSTIEINADTLRVKDSGISTAKIANDAVDKDKIASDVAGNGILQNVDGSLELNPDDSTIEIASGEVLQVKDSGISTAKIADDAVDKDKINADVAGSGLGQNVDGSLEVNVDDSSIEISGDTLQVKAGGVTDAMLATDYIQTTEVDGTTIEFSGGSLNVVALGIDTAQLAADAVDKTKIDADIAGDGLVQAAGGELDVNVDDSTIEIAADVVQVKDLGITNAKIANDTIAEAKLDIHNAPSTGKVLGYTSNGLEWVTGTDDSVLEADIQKEDESANCNGANTTFTLSNTPVANSVQVFLNGLLQQEGSGEDYTLSGTTIEFADAPLTNDILICYYVTNN